MYSCLIDVLDCGWDKSNGVCEVWVGELRENVRGL